MDTVLMILTKVTLQAVLMAQTCCTQGGMTDEQFENFCSSRMVSAKHLTTEASKLIEQNKNLKQEIQLCQTITGTTASPGDSIQTYSTVVDDYQQARQKYLDHREEYDLHVKEFHQQAREDKRPLAALQVPNVKPIAAAVEDACVELQALEQQLKASETELCSMIQTLQAERGKIPNDAYFQKWLNTQTLATNVQNGALQFNRGVATKGINSSNRIHTASQAANVSGDYVQSKNVYAFIQASTAIENEETKRAHLHSNLASECFIYINNLNPNGVSSDNSSTITADQLMKESSDLQTEYNALQTKYSTVQNANPPHN